MVTKYLCLSRCDSFMCYYFLLGYIRIAIQPIKDDEVPEPTNRQSTSSSVLRFSDDDYFPAMAKHSVSIYISDVRFT